MKRSLLVSVWVAAAAISVLAQVRPMESSPSRPAAKPDAPSSVTARYEGGMYGFGEKMSGTLKFDDTNLRLVFYTPEQKELFGIPYEAMLVIYPQSKSVTTTAGNVVRHIPLPGAVLGGFIKEKRRYLIVQFDDPDIDAKGTVNFKLENKETLDAVIQALAARAELLQRGDAYYRPRSASKDN